MRASKRAVVILGKLPPPYIGPAVATQIILNSRLREKFEIYHLDTSDHRDLSTLGRIDFQNVFVALKQYLKLAWFLATRKIDLVYLPNKQTTIGFLQDLPIISITKIFRKKLVCHLRGGNFKNWYLSLSPWLRWIVKKTYRCVDAQIVLSQNLTHLFDGIVSPEKIHVAPNGGNFDFCQRFRNGNGRRMRVLYLANFHKSKGVMDVLHAVPLVDHNGSVEFTFAGSWRDRETQAHFKKFVENENSLPVTVVGSVAGEAKRKLFKASDVFVFPTYYPPEGHPWVIVEAMAAGLPIISTDQGAITESVIDGVNGFIVEKRNPQQIAEKLKILIENPDLRKKMGQESRRLYEENFTEEKMVERLAAVFDKVLSE
jgi:glycosyltransferase involved in cell wall biosynthesis